MPQDISQPFLLERSKVAQRNIAILRERSVLGLFGIKCDKDKAAMELKGLSEKYADCRKAVKDGIEDILPTLNQCSEHIKTVLLQSFSHHLYSTIDVEQLALWLTHSHPNFKELAVRTLSLLTQTPFNRNFVDEAIVRQLLILLSYTSASIRNASIITLTHLTKDKEKPYFSLIKDGSNEALGVLTKSRDPITKALCASLFTSLGAFTPEKFHCIEFKETPVNLCTLLNNPSATVDASNIATTLLDFSQPSEQPLPAKNAIQETMCLPVVANTLIKMLTNQDTNVQINAAATIANLVTKSNERKKTFTKIGVMPALVPMLRSEQPLCIEKALSTLKLFAKGTLETKLALVGAEAVPELVKCIQHDNKAIAYSALLCLDKLAKTQNTEVKKAILTTNVVTTLSKLTEDDSIEQNIKKASVSMLTRLGHTPVRLKNVRIQKALDTTGITLDELEAAYPYETPGNQVFYCPITLSIFVEPVQHTSGSCRLYERSAVLSFWEHSPTLDPYSGEKIENKGLCRAESIITAIIHLIDTLHKTKKCLKEDKTQLQDTIADKAPNSNPSLTLVSPLRPHRLFSTQIGSPLALLPINSPLSQPQIGSPVSG